MQRKCVASFCSRCLSFHSCEGCFSQLKVFKCGHTKSLAILLRYLESSERLSLGMGISPPQGCSASWSHWSQGGKVDSPPGPKRPSSWDPRWHPADQRVRQVDRNLQLQRTDQSIGRNQKWGLPPRKQHWQRDATASPLLHYYYYYYYYYYLHANWNMWTRLNMYFWNAALSEPSLPVVFSVHSLHPITRDAPIPTAPRAPSPSLFSSADRCATRAARGGERVRGPTKAGAKSTSSSESPRWRAMIPLEIRCVTVLKDSVKLSNMIWVLPGQISIASPYRNCSISMLGAACAPILGHPYLSKKRKEGRRAAIHLSESLSLNHKGWCNNKAKANPCQTAGSTQKGSLEDPQQGIFNDL